MTDSLSSLQWQMAGNPLEAWLLAAGAFLLVFLAILALRWFVARYVAVRLDSADSHSPGMLLELVRETRFFFATIAGLFTATRFLVLPERLERTTGYLLALLLLLQIGFWGSALLNFWLRHYTRRRMQMDAASVTTMRAVTLFGKLLLWVVLLLVALQTFGVNVTALVAGLGIGGVAVALAVQSVLGDLIASFSIVLDKPFAVGDSIAVDQVSGTVEQVGLKTTRIRSVTGEQIIMSNTDLARARLRNYKRMSQRRVAFTLGLEYGTEAAKLEQATRIIREIIEATPNTRFERSHFWSFGEKSLLIETVYFVLSPEYNLYMDLQQYINLEIARRFEALGVRFALPGRTVLMTTQTPVAADDPPADG